MTNAQNKMLFYVLKRLFGTVLVGIYILYIGGVFDEGITNETWKIAIWIVVGGFAITFIKDYYKHVMDDKVIRPKQRGTVVGLMSVVPWIIVLVIAVAVKLGFANIFQHLLVIGSLEVLASLFVGMEEYYRLAPEKPVEEEEEETT